jgi:hypothetical protein
MSDSSEADDLPVLPSGPARSPELRRSRRRQAWRDQPSIWFVLLGLCGVVLAGGGTPVWARALVLGVTGLWVLLRPPQETPSRIFECGLLAFGAIALVETYIPAAWLGPMPWRADVLQLGVPLPSTNATSPWLAAEAFVQLVAGVAWLYACWNLRLNHESRRHALWGLAGLTTLLAIGAVAGNLLHLKYPLGLAAMNFSYFPNRNQTALWFSLGGVTAFGVMLDSLQRRRGRSLLAGAMLLPCLMALVLGRSRMAMALFALGSVLVVVIRLGRDAGNYAVRVLIPLAILLMSLLMFFGDETMRRFSIFGGTNAEPDFRLQLWHDTFSLVRAQPLGVGLGQFAQVFPQYRVYSRAYQSILHPDSDWVWVFGETGWAGLLAVAVAVGGLAALFLKKDEKRGPYRSLAALCAGLFLLHSLVDVPGHRFGTWMLAGWFVALAAPDRSPIPTLIPRFAWRGAGVALLAVGILWLAAEFGLPTNSTLTVNRDMGRTDSAIADDDANTAFAAANQAMQIEPMYWRPYFQRARVELTILNSPDDALADFRRARYLEPIWAQVPYFEGLLWLPYDEDRAFAAWREAATREDDVPEGLWRDMYDHLHTLPHGDDYLNTISKTRPLFRFEYLTVQASSQRFLQEWAGDVASDPSLAEYTPDQRQALLSRWAGLDGNATLAYLATRPNIAPNVWLIMADALATTGRAGEAVQLAQQHLPALPIPALAVQSDADPSSLATEFSQDSKNIDLGAALVSAQIDAKDIPGALATLDKLAQLPNPPPFVSWWRASLLLQAGRNDEAWAALQPYLRYHQR